MAKRKGGRRKRRPRTVIFLGAGASVAEGAPTQAKLFREYFQHCRTKRRRSGQHQWDRELPTFFLEFFGIDVDNDDPAKIPFPTFEEVLGVLEIADSQEESFRDWGTSHLVDARQKPRIQHIHELLILLIAEVLDKKLRREGEHHRRLLQRLDAAQALGRTSFVSLNYDILIDNALLDLYQRGGGGWDLDYAVDFSNVEMTADLPDSKWHRPDPERSILLLKLHGSLNWLYCPTCRTLSLTPKQKRVCQLKWRPQDCLCRECDTLAVPIVIPPTYFKALSNLYLRQIWDRAEKELAQAERIIFCGYSFPDADIHVKYLLKRAELNRRSMPPEVFIVNEPEGKPVEARDAERARYLRFLKAKDRIHWTRLSFEQFAENPNLIEDPKQWL